MVPRVEELCHGTSLYQQSTANDEFFCRLKETGDLMGTVSPWTCRILDQRSNAGTSGNKLACIVWTTMKVARVAMAGIKQIRFHKRA